MPYKTQAQRTRRQRQRRRAGLTKRIEITLSAESADDHEIADFMDSLPRGASAGFIKAAILEKMGKEPAAPEVPDPIDDDATASNEFNALLIELDQQRREAGQHMAEMIATLTAQSAEISALRDQLSSQLVQGQILSEGIDMARPRAAVAASSGIDTARPRPRAAKTITPAPVALDGGKLTQAEQIRLAQVMAKSVRNAQPGRG